MIYYDRCIDQLTSIVGGETPLKATVYHRFSEFNRGRSVLTGEYKEGRLKSIVVLKNIDAVRELIMQDRHITNREIKMSLGITPLENRKTVSSEWYRTICLPEVFEEIRKNNRQRSIILHHHNASWHTSAETTRFLEGKNQIDGSYGSYSSVLAPNDFYLFLNEKNKLHRQRF
ncbi:hypothetical protein EVAR_28219_1 [Eumeta japonica]|uniref:Mariner Mos1 transposase n=1 Tax=Eumeta variegata TaxID=151549 RepID=A0A4C1VIL1_EUMVA|nr:hypothetical protein EVAR_28219_1 [Eumeta japonica]